MNKYKMYEVTKAIEAYKDNYSAYKRSPKVWRSENRKWDRIIRALCTGCGKTENLKGLAFCFSCREILFPETVADKKYRRQKSRYRTWRGHFL